MPELATDFRIQERNLLCDAETFWRQEVERLRSCLDENEPKAFLKLANAFDSRGDYSSALATLRDGIGRCAPSSRLFRAAVRMLAEGNQTEEARSLGSRATEIFPSDYFFRLAAILVLPALYQTFENIELWRGRFSTGLSDFISRLKLDTEDECSAMLTAIRRYVNFYLIYQARNDRWLQQQYGVLVHTVLAANYPNWVNERRMPDLPPDRRIRVGYLSARFSKNSTVVRTHAGWLTQLDRGKIELFAYQIGNETESDSGTDDIRRASDHFRQVEDLAEICRAVLADDLHVAVFIDIGMYGLMTILSGLRLAPIQCQTWGHPITSGSPVIDYFLSSDLMEPANADLHYNERLIRLPGIGCYTEKPVIPRVLLNKNRARFGLGEGRTVYLCCQYSSKYLPQHDHVFVDIAERNPLAQFTFVPSNNVVAADLSLRLQEAFSIRGLNAADYCVMLPRYKMLDYWNLYLVSDVFLDTIDFSGFLTTLDAVAFPLPVVTLPGEFHRGRQSYAILTQLGVSDTIARDKADYVDLAVRLGQDRVWRAEIVRRMREGHPALFQDTRSVRALEDFYQRVVAEALVLQEASCSSDSPS